MHKSVESNSICTLVHKLDSGEAAFAASVTQGKRPPVSGEPAGVFLFGEPLVYRVPDDGVGVENSEIPIFQAPVFLFLPLLRGVLRFGGLLALHLQLGGAALVVGQQVEDARVQVFSA